MKKYLSISLSLLLLVGLAFAATGCQSAIGNLVKLPGANAPAETEEAAPVATEEVMPEETEGEVMPTEESEPMATATAVPVASPAPTEATEEPAATPAPADADFVPLPGSECSDLSQTLSSVFGLEFSIDEVPFQDYLTGETGSGCAVRAMGTGNDFASPSAVGQQVADKLVELGWTVDNNYAADGPTGTVVAFDKEDQICLLDASWSPSPDANCPEDQPIASCELTPDQKMFDVILTCAQRTAAAVENMGTGAESEPAEGAGPQETLPEPTAQAPAVPPPDQAHRIEFPPGGSSATIEDDVQAGEVDLYVLRAAQGQTLTVNVSSPKGNAILTIWGADGTVLISDHAGARDWSGQLPLTEDYYIGVSPVAGTSTIYTLYVSVSPLTPPPPTVTPPTVTPMPTATPGVQPIRIEFAPGTDAVTVAGSAPPQTVTRYVLWASGGQTMSVNVFAATGQAILVIWGDDGTVLISDHAGATSWSGQLPLTQDYFIDVVSVGNTTSNYTLQVVIPPGPGPSQPTTQRISFATGSISATEQGTVPAGGIMRYLVGAMVGQSMSVSLSSPQNDVLLVIWGADGTVLLSDHAGVTSWSGSLPASQDYIIDVKSFGTVPSNFTLQVTIPPL